MKRLYLVSVFDESKGDNDATAAIDCIAFHKLRPVEVTLELQNECRVFNRVDEDRKHSGTVTVKSIDAFRRHIAAPDRIQRLLGRVVPCNVSFLSIAAVANEPEEVTDAQGNRFSVGHRNGSSKNGSFEIR